MTSPDVHDLLGAYALSALTDIERRDFERHLDGCAACRDELRGLHETTAALASASAHRPPPELKPKVLDEISRTRQLPPHLRGLNRRRPAKLWPLLAAACMALALVFGVRAQLQLNDLEARERRIAAVLAAPDARTATAGSGTVVFSRARNEAVVVMSGLPSLPDGQAYQLWFIGPNPPRSAGIMASAAPLLTSGMGDATRIGITIEPAGGSTAPSTTPLATIPLPRLHVSHLRRI